MKNLINLKKLFKRNKIDGYIIPKNDEFFGEYIPKNKDNLKFISQFSGSYGFAIILKNSNYLFVDGRYTLQAKMQSGKNFKIFTIPNELPSDILKNKKISIGFDPKLHTELMINRVFKNTKCKLIPISKNLVNQIWKRKNDDKPNKFYLLNDKDAGESSKKKLLKLSRMLIKNKIDFQFISAPENIAWLLNLRGSDSEFTPIPNSYLIISKEKKVFFFCDLKKITNGLKKKLDKNIIVIDIKSTAQFLLEAKNKNFQIDNASCSIFFKNIIKINNKIVEKQDPIYLLKSAKNKVELSINA